HYAAEQDLEEAARALVTRHGVLVDAPAPASGQTPLMAAVRRCSQNVMDVLLCAGADLAGPRDTAGRTALDWMDAGGALALAAAKGKVGLVRRFLDWGADPNKVGSVDGGSGTPLVAALQRSFPVSLHPSEEDTLVRLLLDAGADPSKPDGGFAQ
ncbi:unnamed protein product, partial [Heterosigma akashiwo]